MSQFDLQARVTVLEEQKAELVFALEFALAIDDHFDRLEFIKGYIEGDTAEWPEFARRELPHG